MDFKHIEYMKNGTTMQQKTYRILTELNILNVLAEYTPLVVGTIPINIEIKSSDVDIVCEVHDFQKFEQEVLSYYPQAQISKKENIIVARFVVDELEIELYGSTKKSCETNGYRHMIIEYRILMLANHKFKELIVELKKTGVKTEPAFAKIMQLQGNPYEELLTFEQYTDDELLNYLRGVNDGNSIY